MFVHIDEVKQDVEGDLHSNNACDDEEANFSSAGLCVDPWKEKQMRSRPIEGYENRVVNQSSLSHVESQGCESPVSFVEARILLFHLRFLLLFLLSL